MSQIDLIDRAALLKQLRRERADYFSDHFVTDPETGAAEAGRAKEEYLDYLDERIEFIDQFPAAPLDITSIEIAVAEVARVRRENERWIARVKELEARLDEIRGIAR